MSEQVEGINAMDYTCTVIAAATNRRYRFLLHKESNTSVSHDEQQAAS
jgi:hypothetical protein